MLLIALIVATNASAAAYTADQCVSCHERSDSQLAASVHANSQRPIDCTDCHATHGQDDARSANAPLRMGRDLATCGACHAAELATYRSTYHGKHAALGKANVPTCAFCHAGHELPSTNELSPIFAANVARVCSSCHADGTDAQAVMATTLNTPRTGRYLYRKNAGAWIV